jgi:hypothetical protein
MRLCRIFSSVFATCALIATAPVLQAVDTSAATEPVITSVRGRTVVVSVPAGFDRVMLQAVRPARQRKLAAGDDSATRWKTIATKYPHREARRITFRLPRLTPKRHLRVLGNQDEVLPGSFFTGITSFLGDPPMADNGSSANFPPGAVNGAAGPDGLLSSGKTNESDVTRTVVEADIWKVFGDRLYFFNQLRGLQLFDLSDPDEPALIGTVRMPAAGEDLYVLPSGDAVLLKQGSYELWDPWMWNVPVAFGGGGVVSIASDAPALRLAGGALFIPSIPPVSTSEIVMVGMAAGKPAIVARIPFDGTLRESRMVGDILYVASEVNEKDPDGLLPSWHCRVTSFDLHDPAHPVRRDSIDLDGWPNAVTATDSYFLVARWDSSSASASGGNVIDIIDISAADGAMKRGGAAKVKGSIADKFKMHQEGTTLTAISSSWRYENAEGKPLPEWAPNARWVPFTTVETFSLANVNTPVALDSLEIAAGETVRATRFDNGRVYVVTFVQIDPLWIVDLSAPERIKILGHVEAPGFSTYIEPLGDRLVTVGLVRNQPAVSLFDVSEGGHPLLLKQVLLANDNANNNWVWSEAVWDEKAFRVLADEKLILLPVSSYNYPSGSAGRVQLIDLLRNDLVKRGVIEAEFFPRRATLHQDRVVSIAPNKLVTVDATDRDHPVVQSEIEIAWNTSRVFAVGDHLIEIGPDTFDGNPRLTVTPAAEPEATLTTKDLPIRFSVIGAVVRDDVLFIAQMQNPWEVANANGNNAADHGVLHLSTFDVSALPAIKPLGTASTEVRTASGWGSSELEPLWPNPTTLVWSGEGEVNGWGGGWFDPIYLMAASAPATESAGGFTKRGVGDVSLASTSFAPRFPRWSYSRSRVLHAFDVALPERPKSLPTVEVGKGEPWDVSRAFAAEGAIYLSHKNLGERSADPIDDAAAVDADGAAKDVNRHFLDVIRFDDPAHPRTDDAHPNLPGRLVGISRHGRLLYTMGRQYDVVTGKTLGSAAALHASAFDGNVVHLLDNIPLSAEGQPFAVSGETLFLLKPEPTHIPGNDPQTYGWVENPATSKLSTLTVTDERKFLKLDEIPLGHESTLSLFGNLVVAHGGGSSRVYFLAWNAADFWSGGNSRHLHFVDATNPADLQSLGTYTFDGAIYPNLTYADGDLAHGVWVPLGDYGVEFVPIGQGND